MDGLSRFLKIDEERRRTTKNREEEPTPIADPDLIAIQTPKGVTLLGVLLG